MAKKPQKKTDEPNAKDGDGAEKKKEEIPDNDRSDCSFGSHWWWDSSLLFLFASSGDAEAIAVADVPAPIFFYDLPTLVVNLNTNGGPVEFLRLTATLEYADESQLPLIEERMPRVLDGFQVYLRELRRSDLEGSAGLYRLKQDLVRRVNLSIQPAEINDILFKDILVQ